MFFGGKIGIFPDAYAYSLRQIGIINKAIRAQRASDGDSLDIGFVGGELDTATLVDFSLGGNVHIDILYEQNGSGKDYINDLATVTNKPTIVENGVVNMLNGKPCLRFVRANQQLLFVRSTFLFLHQSQSTVFNVNSVNFLNSSNITLGYMTTGSQTPDVGFSLFFQNITSLGRLNSSHLSIVRGVSGSYTVLMINSAHVVSGGQNLIYNYNDPVNAVASDRAQIIINQDLRANNTALAPINLVNEGNGLVMGVLFDFLGQITTTTYFDGTFQEQIIFNGDYRAQKTEIETNINEFYNIF